MVVENAHNVFIGLFSLYVVQCVWAELDFFCCVYTASVKTVSARMFLL